MNNNITRNDNNKLIIIRLSYEHNGQSPLPGSGWLKSNEDVFFSNLAGHKNRVTKLILANGSFFRSSCWI